MTPSTQSLKPLRCVTCNRIIAYVDGNASVRCRHCKPATVTLYVGGVPIRLSLKEKEDEEGFPQELAKIASSNG